MIQANELRIGNCVYIDWLDIDTGKWHKKEHEITYRDLWNLENGNELVKKSYNPIPITEEWAEKLPNDEWEFVVFGTTIICKHNKYRAIKLVFINNSVKFFFNNKLINLKQYVHSLQNLYFALTGEELTLKN